MAPDGQNAKCHPTTVLHALRAVAEGLRSCFALQSVISTKSKLGPSRSAGLLLLLLLPLLLLLAKSR
jgi:hypothetical protein